MQNRFSFAAIVTFVAIAAFTLFGCGYHSPDVSSVKRVDIDLRGTWERTESAFWPEGQTETSGKGKIVLGFDTITISDPVGQADHFDEAVVDFAAVYLDSCQSRPT
ncbi:hypothetical protein FACS1894141_3510 [Spirochaetia bacterium]|nr:hypothetical protein FACS1894141_3510 [Spirochaetia bacterium]